MSLRIALVTQGFAIGGGVPAVVRWLRAGLEGRGHAVTVHDLATSASDPFSRRLASPVTWGRRTLRSSGSHGIVSWGADAVELEPMRYRQRPELTNELNSYDLVQVVAGAPALALVTRGLRRPTALQVASTVRWERAAQLEALRGPRRHWRTGMTALVSRMETQALRTVDVAMVENALMAEFVRAAGQSEVIVAPPGIDTELFSPPSDGWNRLGPIVSVCRLGDPRKGLERTIQAFAELRAGRGDSPNLVLVGRGRLGSAAADLVGALGLNAQVAVESDVTNVELAQLLRRASVFVQSSYEEGLGISVLEAMSSGLPVVATATAGSRETVIDGVTGFLVDQSDPARVPTRLAKAIERVLDSDGPAMAQAGRSRVTENFEMAAMIDAYEAAYERLLGGPGGATLRSRLL